MNTLSRRRFFSVFAAGMTALVLSPAATQARPKPVTNPPLDIRGTYKGSYTPQSGAPGTVMITITSSRLYRKRGIQARLLRGTGRIDGTSVKLLLELVTNTDNTTIIAGALYNFDKSAIASVQLTTTDGATLDGGYVLSNKRGQVLGNGAMTLQQ